MTHDNPDPFDLGQAEWPTWAAELGITAEPVQTRSTPQGLTAEVTMVPADQADHLITTFGIAGSIVTGTAGAVVTLRIAPWLTAIALAELALALAGAALIALCSRAHRTSRAAGLSPDEPGEASRAGQETSS
jgi:hypothetical protein